MTARRRQARCRPQAVPSPPSTPASTTTSPLAPIPAWYDLHIGGDSAVGRLIASGNAARNNDGAAAASERPRWRRRGGTRRIAQRGKSEPQLRRRRRTAHRATRQLGAAAAAARSRLLLRRRPARRSEPPVAPRAPSASEPPGPLRVVTVFVSWCCFHFFFICGRNRTSRPTSLVRVAVANVFSKS